MRTAGRRLRKKRSPIQKTDSRRSAALPGVDGVYVFNARFLFEQLCLDATRPGVPTTFGHNIIPSLIDTNRLYAFPFRDENRKQDAYWRDVGTLDAYYAASMDLISVDPLLNMYDEHWPIPHVSPNYPPPKFVFRRARPRSSPRRSAR